MTQTNLEIPQGATWNRVITYMDSNRVPIDLTGYTAKMQLRSDYGQKFAYLTLSTGTGEIVITPLTGTIEITISATVTKALKVYTYVYDLEITSPGSVVTRLLQGKITVTPEVTM
jgi:hypothetical protein